MIRSAALILACLTAAVDDAKPIREPRLNPELVQLAPNVWWKLHEQRPEDDVRFRRQGHGGSCFDSKRGRLVLFGSDTHGRDWTNSPLVLDPVAKSWTRLTQRAFLKGWHTNCVYDAKHRALVIFGHNENRNVVETFFPSSGEHRLMPTPGKRPPKDQHNPMAFDPLVGKTVVVVDRGKGDGSGTAAETWLYDLGEDSWSQLKTATLPFGCGMNYNMEYDPNHECLLLVTGGYRQQTTVWALKVRGTE